MIGNGLPMEGNDAFERLWLSDGFDFTGFDALLILPTVCSKDIAIKDEKETTRLDLALRTLPRNLADSIMFENIFPVVTVSDTGLSPDAKVLVLTTTVVQFSRGSSAARLGLGYGAGLPYIKVEGAALHGDGIKFRFLIDRKGKWFGTGFLSSESIQAETIRSLSKELAQFMGRTARREQKDSLR